MGWRDNAETVGASPEKDWRLRAEKDPASIPEPDLAPTRQMLAANKSAAKAREPEKTASPAQEKTGGVEVNPEIKQAETFLEAVEAGWDMSVTGLMMKKPDVVLKEHPEMYMRIAAGVAGLAGDIPAMAAGGVLGGIAGAPIGGAAGSVVPVVGTLGGVAAGVTLGTGAGMFAAPAGMRQVLMDHYEKGDVQSFSDFWERASAATIEAAKGGVIGAATVGIGGAVAKALAPRVAPAIAKTSAELASEVLTMTTVGAALEGQMPEPEEFIDAAIIIGGMHAIGMASTKARRMYVEKGMKPAELVAHAEANPHIKQQILADNVEIPSGGELGITVKNPKPPENFPAHKPLYEPKSELSDSVNTILSNVGEKEGRSKKLMTTREIYTAFVDKLDPINQATKALTENKVELLAENNPYVLARTAVDAPAKAKHFFEKGTLDYETKATNGESLRSILESVESPEILDAYLISKRAIEKSSQGKVTGFDVDAAHAVVKEHGAKYEQAARRVTEFSNRALKYVKDAGLLTDEQHTRMLESNRDYVPFKRIIEQSDVPGAKRGGGKTGSLKEFKGSERAIQSPVTSILENTIELIKLAENNRPKKALVELAEKTEGQTLVNRVKTPVQEVEISAADVAKQLDVDITEAQAITTFRAIKKDLAPGQFAVFRDGKREVYETTPQIAEAISKLGGDSGSTNIFFKIAHGITTVKKVGITFTPDFIMKNLFRDSLTASSFTKGKPVTPADFVGAMGDLIKKNDTYYEWLKSGGANGAFLDMGERYVQKDIWKLQRETNFLNSVRNVVEKPIDVMRVAAELSEQSLRLAEFKKVRAGGGSLEAGGFASREITLDFQRVGAKMSALNSITAFMNVSIQGLDKTVRAMKEDPTGVAIKGATYITAPSVLLWYANKDDERYKEIPRWQKDLFWIIPTDSWQDATPNEAASMPPYMVRTENGKTQINKGTIYRLPKPQELGMLFGSVPERLLEQFFTDNPDAMKDFEKTIGELVTPSFVPDAVAPAMEQYFNKSFFTGREIIPHHLKDIMPEYQFVEYTSETAKTLGKMIATVDKTSDFASPMVLENYIRSWGGALGQYAVQIADKGLRATGVVEDITKPASTLSDIPFIKSFVVRFPAAGSNSVQDFYQAYEESNKVMKTIKYLAKQGDFDNMQKEMMLDANQDKLVNLSGIKDALSAQSSTIRLINKNPEMSADEKRQMIDGLYLQMTEVAKQGNVLVQELKKSVEENK